MQVIADIDSHTPISEDTLASLSMQGVTGPALHRPAGQRRHQAQHGFGSERAISRSSIPCSRTSTACSRACPTWSAAPRWSSTAPRACCPTTTSWRSPRPCRTSRQTSATLPGAMRDAAVVIADLKATLADVRVAATSARQLIDTSGPNLAAASERMRAISENLAKTTANLDRLMADHREDLGLFLRDSLPEIERLLRDSRSAAQEFRELSRSLKADPSQLLVRAELQRRGDSAMKTRASDARCCARWRSAGCGSLLDSDDPGAAGLCAAPAAATAPPRPPTPPAACCVQRPEAGPGLDSRTHRAAAQRPAFRFLCGQPLGCAGARSRRERDGRCAARHAARSPRCSTTPRHTRRATTCAAALRRFEADYTTGGGAPTIFVALDCTLGRHRDRELLASFTAQGSAVAAEDRLTRWWRHSRRRRRTAMSELAQRRVARRSPRNDAGREASVRK